MRIKMKELRRTTSGRLAVSRSIVRKCSSSKVLPMICWIWIIWSCLRKFIIGARRRDGLEYSPDTLVSLVSSLNNDAVKARSEEVLSHRLI